MPAVPSNANALAFFPESDAGADVVDYPRDFVARGAGIKLSGHGGILDEMVAETNSACLHKDAHLPRTGLGNIALLNLKIATGVGHHGYLHFWHWSVPRGTCVMFFSSWMPATAAR